MPETGGLKKLEKLIGKIFLIKDPYITKLMVASVVSQFISADPVWLVVVAPSGGCKSEFINMLSTFSWQTEGEPEPQKVWPISTLSSHTFVSGMRNVSKETSLLLQIQNGIITFKDLTSLL